MRNWRTIPVPEDMRDMPRDLLRGFPILFSQTPPIDGWEPSTEGHDFRIVIVERVQECVTKKLCGVCGKPLGYWIAFVGGPLSIKNRAFVDPPMHTECALYAVQVCPFMVSRSVPRREDGPIWGKVSADERQKRDPTGILVKSDVFGVLITRGYAWENSAQATARRNPQVRAQLKQGMRVEFPASMRQSMIFVAQSPKEVRWFRDGEELPRGYRPS